MAREPKMNKKTSKRGPKRPGINAGIAPVDPNEPQAMQLPLMMRLFPTFARTFAPKSVAAAGLQKKHKEEKPRLPIVNLLPPRLALEKMRRSTRRNFSIAAVVIVAVAGLAWLGEATVIAVQQSALDQAKAAANAKSVEVAQYKSIKDYILSIQARKQVILERTGQQADYEKINKVVLAALPSGTRVTLFQVTAITYDSLTKTSQDVAKQCGPVTDPFAITDSAPLACLTVNGTVGNRADIPRIALALQDNKMFWNLSSTQAADSRSGIGFTLKGVITTEALYKALTENTSTSGTTTSSGTTSGTTTDSTSSTGGNN